MHMKALFLICAAMISVSVWGDHLCGHDLVVVQQSGAREDDRNGEHADETPRSMTVAEETKYRMKGLIIPRAHIRRPSLHFVIQFLVEAAKALDPESTDFRIIVSLPCMPERERSTQRLPSIANDPWDEDFVVSQPPTPLCGANHALSRTLNMSRVSVYNVLTQITEQADLEYRIDDSGVVFIECGRSESVDQRDTDNDVNGQHP